MHKCDGAESGFADRTAVDLEQRAFGDWYGVAGGQFHERVVRVLGVYNDSATICFPALKELR